MRLQESWNRRNEWFSEDANCFRKKAAPRDELDMRPTSSPADVSEETPATAHGRVYAGELIDFPCPAGRTRCLESRHRNGQRSGPPQPPTCGRCISRSGACRFHRMVSPNLRRTGEIRLKATDVTCPCEAVHVEAVWRYRNTTIHCREFFLNTDELKYGKRVSPSKRGGHSRSPRTVWFIGQVEAGGVAMAGAVDGRKALRDLRATRRETRQATDCRPILCSKWSTWRSGRRREKQPIGQAGCRGKAAGISLRSVQRILEAHQLAPRRIRMFKIVERSEVRGEAQGHCRPLRRPTRPCRCPFGRREEPNSGARLHPAGPADEAGRAGTMTARLQAPRHHDAVRRRQVLDDTRHRSQHETPPPSGIHPLSQYYRGSGSKTKGDPRRRRLSRLPNGNVGNALNS